MNSLVPRALQNVLLGIVLLAAGCASQNYRHASMDVPLLVIRSWPGELPPAAQASAVLRAGEAQLSARLLAGEGLTEGERFPIHLFDGEVVRVALERVSSDIQGVRQVRARLLEPYVGILLLSIRGESVIGNLVIESDGRAFRLRHDASSGRHYMAQVDPSAEDVLPGSPPMQQ
jgi:hypothetical protein